MVQMSQTGFSSAASHCISPTVVPRVSRFPRWSFVLLPTSRLAIILALLLPFSAARGQGKVYLVLGSDTAIWESMNVDRYQNTYKPDLFTDPTRNGHQVMDPAFRTKLVDSYGQPMKLTWWMMAGNIFRYATNKNVPIPNIMTLHLMQQYHGESISRYGDELTLHYHTFTWTDYNNDGKYYWNQAKSFEECRSDFDFTLAQFLVEENVFPVSFRSGWHAMDSGWQRYLDELLPYSMHNDWPSKRTDPTEPIDNEFDWSHSPSTWVPWHPSPDDFRIPGNARGWNLRSKHIGSVNAALMDTIFARAKRGIDQVACLWGHLPETDFLDNLKKIDSLAHRSEAKYAGVTFRYASAVEAMQRWIGSADTTAPQLTITEERQGETVSFTIQADEPIFQKKPIVALKDLYERYSLVPVTQVGTNLWRSDPVREDLIAKIAVAVTDTMGNLTTESIPFLPDDIYVDNKDQGYSEPAGTWSTIASTTWGVDSRMATLSEQSVVRARWTPSLSKAGRYRIHAQIPVISNPAGNLRFLIYSAGLPVDSVFFGTPPTGNEWISLGAFQLDPGAGTYVELVVDGASQSGKRVGVDVVKFSSLVRDRQLVLQRSFVDFGPVSKEDTVETTLTVTNGGVEQLRITGISSSLQELSCPVQFPLVLEGGTSTSVPLRFAGMNMGKWSDTLYVVSDDPIEPSFALPFAVDVRNYFQVIDNETAASYQEAGAWSTSVTQAYGASSRYAFVSSAGGASASYLFTVKRSGTYDLLYIVPTTVNSATKALYTVRVGSQLPDSLVVDQNAGSGGWVLLGSYECQAGDAMNVRVIDTGKNPAGVVLRADAIRIEMVTGATAADRSDPGPLEYQLRQNYPNPFNPATVIGFSVVSEDWVTLKVFDLLGREVATVVDGMKVPGFHQIRWDAAGLPSGVYYYQIRTGSFVETRKMILMR
jgi:hypothetical protein